MEWRPAGLLVLAATGAVFLVRSLGPPAATASEVSAIVVLPLQDLSPERGGEYFAAAMTEALTTDLARIGAFRVLSRRSIDQYAETHGSLAGVASSLGADAAVEGSIVRADGRVRINVQLTDAYTDTHLWTESYERELVDILALQGEVARAIASELSSSVARGFGSAEAPPRVDPLAHDLYLQGRHALGRCFFEGPNEAADFFQRAIDADPGFAPAYAGLADYYSILTLYDFLQPHEGFPKARGAALKALELDPGSAEAHAALAHVEFMFDWNWERADGGFRRALELNPSNADGHRAYAFFLTCMGRFEEAVEQAQLQIELDPLNDRSHLAWVLFNARRHDESLAELERGPEPATLQFAQQLSSMSKQRALVGWNYALLGRHGEAIDILGPVAAARGSRNPTVLGVLGWTLASAGRGGEAREVLGRLEELAASQTSGDLYAQVIVLTALGETERALDLLEQTVLQRSPNAIFLAVEPFLESLADEPRYQRLLESVGLSRPAS
ncbi:MAG: hypothetical protein O7A98_03370 [Acidobacteria bacterium]|nr:hypothetical protein [Acidobacteriota bacterium]